MKLKRFQFDLIGGKSFLRQENRRLSLILEYFQNINANFFVLDPFKNLSIFLDFTKLLALSYYFLMIPLHFTYHSFAVNSLKIDIDTIALSFLVLDILRIFNTAFYLKGKLVYARWEIAIHYIQDNFMFDALSLLPAFIVKMGEVCFCIVFIFLACGIFAYSINSIGIILTDILKQQIEYRTDLNTINDFMRKKKISFDLRTRIRKYLEYIIKGEIVEEDETTSRTIDKLSNSLREELLLEAYGSILNKIEFFSSNFRRNLRKTVNNINKNTFLNY